MIVKTELQELTAWAAQFLLWALVGEFRVIALKWCLTEVKKAELLRKGSCLLNGRTNKVRLFSLSVQERKTPPHCPRDQHSSPWLEIIDRSKEGKKTKKEKEKKIKAISQKGKKKKKKGGKLFNSAQVCTGHSGLSFS